MKSQQKDTGYDLNTKYSLSVDFCGFTFLKMKCFLTRAPPHVAHLIEDTQHFAFIAMSSKDVCCQPTANAPSDVMVGAVGEPRFGAE